MKGLLIFLIAVLSSSVATAHRTTFRSACFMPQVLPEVRAEIEQRLGLRTWRIFLNINVPGAAIPSVGSQEFQSIRLEGRDTIHHRTFLEIPEDRAHLVLVEYVYDRETNRCAYLHAERIEATRLEHFEVLGRYVLRRADGREVPAP